MMDVFKEAVQSWQNFYFMAGGSAAGLIGLMFVALSLAVNLTSREIGQEAKAFITPSIIYFVTALFISCVMLIPLPSPVILTLVFTGTGLIGLAQTLPAVRRLIHAALRDHNFFLVDWLTQVIFPVVIFICLPFVGLGFALAQWDFALTGLWLVTVLLLMCAVGNTWSLMIWLIEQPRNKEPSS
jgi:hypothetical protein